MAFVASFFKQAASIAENIDCDAIEAMAEGLAEVRARGGRLFILGVGGSAGNAGHAVNDFRKLCSMETYAPTDNVSELTARANDEGWDTIFSEWLKVSRLSNRDGVLVFSVGGGDLQRNVSPNLVKAVQFAKERQATVFGIVGRRGGYTHQVGDHVVVIPSVDDSLVTPHSEAFQAVVWHCLVSHPKLKTMATKWESVVVQAEKV